MNSGQPVGADAASPRSMAEEPPNAKVVAGAYQANQAELPRLRQRSDAPFFLVMGGISASFILLIILLLVAD
ncbi:MAG: hypothetical protein IT423_12810, partial [Pirellulaceae bacterium]|nr:hypothetical protein [Pirellulaceae bacterium]